jgi:hypothetical protein
MRSIGVGVSSLRQAQDGKSQLRLHKSLVLIGILDEKSQKILLWLSPLNMDQKQQDTYSRHQENTGKWLLEKKGFVDWLEADERGATLWCPGNRKCLVRIRPLDTTSSLC